MTGRVQDKIAVVFGAGSSGPGWSNGKAAAVLYAREGAKVLAVDVNSEAARETQDLIQREGGECVLAVADVSNSSDVARVIAEAVTSFGRIDILHNNVGITVMGDPTEIGEDSWDRVMDVNAKGVFLACKHALPIMLKQNHGVIINISSLAAIQVNKYPYFSYYASKAAVNHFTRAIAVHYAPHGIRANVVMPGVMNTPLIHKQIAGQFENADEMLKARHAASPMGRMGDAWDVAYASLFLASDEAKYITGVCLPVDGGKSCAGR